MDTTHEHLATLAVAVGMGTVESAVRSILNILIADGLTNDAVDKAKEMVASETGLGTPDELELLDDVREAFGFENMGFHLDDPVARRRALDWLEKIRPLLN